MQIFSKKRKTEPKLIRRCRISTMTLFLVLLFGYTTILMVDVVNDTPIIRTELKSVSSIPLPTVAILFNLNFTTSCAFIYNNGTSSNREECNQYIKQLPPTVAPGTSVKQNTLAFMPPLNLHVQTSDNSSGLAGVALSNIVTDSTFDANNASLTDLTFGMTIVVSDTEFSSNEYEKTRTEIDKIDPTLSNSLYQQSTYSISYQQIHVLAYNRNERRLIKRNALTTIGMPSGLIRVPYITTSLVTGPLTYHPNTLDPNLYGGLIIRASNFVVRTEIEFRMHTMLSLIGLLGGAWGLSISLYAILFGDDSLRPWGWVQFYCCCFVPRARSRLHQSFSIIPLQQQQQQSVMSLSNRSFQSRNFTSQDLSEDLRKQLNSLERSTKERLDALELFVQEYIVDTTYLDGLNENNYPNKLSSLFGYFFERRNRDGNNAGTSNLSASYLL